MNQIWFLIILLFYLSIGEIDNLSGQNSNINSVYRINRKTEIPITVGLFGAALFGFEYLSNKPALTLNEVIQLDSEDIWWFDRSATKQDPFSRQRAHNISDIVLNSSVALPVLFALDKKIRKDWFDLLILYGESQAISSDLYILNASLTSRVRPFVYHPDVSGDDKLAPETRNSFYSGHVSSAATASFFMAKVYSDYHPEFEGKKYWLYAAAVVPPSLVGYYRFKAMKHFPTDILTGFVTGAAAGILIPELHHITNEKSGLSFVPFSGKFSGLKINYTF